MRTHEAYVVEERTAKELVFLVAMQQPVSNLYVTYFDGYGYHVEWDCEDEIYQRILVYISNNQLLHRKVNWV